jgi:hypothetical protein
MNFFKSLFGKTEKQDQTIVEVTQAEKRGEP